jgi:hypothetical protein
MAATKGAARRAIARRAGPARYTQMPGPDRLDAGDGSPAEDVARYIADMTLQLGSMASGAKLDLLAYFLNMAHAECVATMRQAGLTLDAS